MKKIVLFLMLLIFLSGCAEEKAEVLNKFIKEPEQPKVPYVEVINNEIKIIGIHTYIFFNKTELMQVAGTSRCPDSSETYINRAKDSIEYFDKAYVLLQDLYDYNKFPGEKIGARVFDTVSGGGYGGGNPIGVGNYPYENMALDLQTYFHEIAHSFTNSHGLIYAFSEARAHLGQYYINLRLSEENSDFSFFRDLQRQTRIRRLESYESYGSPFEEIHWDKSVGEELQSSSIAAGMYITMAEKYGWENLAKLRDLEREIVDFDIDKVEDLTTIASAVAHQWRPVGGEEIVDMFLEWNFPLHADSDGDGISDEEEIRAGNNPFRKG